MRPFRGSLLRQKLQNIFTEPPKLAVTRVLPKGFMLTPSSGAPYEHKGPLLILNHRSRLWNAVYPKEEVQAVHAFMAEWIRKGSFDAILEAKPDILVLGTGRMLVPPTAQLLAYFKEHKLAVEVLQTRQACETFNVLSEEGRNVAAALLPLVSLVPPNKNRPVS